MIYNYLKEKLEFATNDPNEYRRLIIEAERDLNRIKRNTIIPGDIALDAEVM